MRQCEEQFFDDQEEEFGRFRGALERNDDDLFQYEVIMNDTDRRLNDAIDYFKDLGPRDDLVNDEGELLGALSK